MRIELEFFFISLENTGNSRKKTTKRILPKTFFKSNKLKQIVFTLLFDKFNSLFWYIL